jgi:phage gp29-like protein
MARKNRIAAKQTQAPSVRVIPQQLQRLRQDAATRKEAINEAEQAYFPFRVKLQQLYLNTMDNLHIAACIERRKDLTLLRKWEFRNAAGEIDKETTDLFCNTINKQTQLKTWFNNYLSYVLDALYFGYSLINLNDIINDEFPKIETLKRWNISPDRCTLSSYPYLTTGIDFINDEAYNKFLVWVNTPNNTGISSCGYGLFYQLSMLEIFLRNLIGYNGDFVELFAQPFRVGKTNKTEDSEREAFADILRNMGTSGWAMIDEHGEEINFLETSLGGTGWQGYDNFEQRLQAQCSRFILGHEDAISSKAGKLGNDHSESPAELAMQDKATKDAAFLLPYVNNVLFDKMRALGFNIPEGTVACMKNDKEELSIAKTFAMLGKQIKEAGFQMDPQQFTEKTGIKLQEVVQQIPINSPGLPQSMQNRLKNFYKGKQS